MTRDFVALQVDLLRDLDETIGGCPPHMIGILEELHGQRVGLVEDIKEVCAEVGMDPRLALGTMGPRSRRLRVVVGVTVWRLV